MAITSTSLTDTELTRVFQADGQQIVSVMYLCNHSNSAVTVNVFCISSDDSTAGGEDNIIYSQLEIEAHDTYVMSTEKLILDDSDELEVEANVGGSVTVTVSSFPT